MYKKMFIGSLVLIVLAALVAGIYGSTQASSTQFDAGLQSRDHSQTGEMEYIVEGNNRQVNQAGQSAQIEQQQTKEYDLPAQVELSEAEVEGLLFMHEEEKLARDVYAMLFATWELPVFQNITASEQAHMDAVKVLINSYGLSDAALPQPGAFNDPELQALYDELVARGSQSLAEALKVGAAIEEIDILDLQTYLAQTDNPDVQRVYVNLLSGSQNHLRAFTKTLLTQTGETYQPLYLSLEDYQVISQSAQGGQGGQARQDGRGNKGWGGGRQ